MKCPVCGETEQQHQLRKNLCPEIDCGCKNCYWCGHQIQLTERAIDLDIDDAIEEKRFREWKHQKDYEEAINEHRIS